MIRALLLAWLLIWQPPTPTAEVWDTWQPAAVTMVKTGTLYANLRAQPSLSAAIVGRVYPGSVEVSYARAADGWQRVRVMAAVGWVSETAAMITPLQIETPTPPPPMARALDLLAQAEALEVQAAQLRAQAILLLYGG